MSELSIVDNKRKIAVCGFYKSELPFLKKAYHISYVAINKEYRGKGLSVKMYNFLLNKLDFLLFSDTTQTPGSRGLWRSLYDQPGINVMGFIKIDDVLLYEQTVDGIMNLGGLYLGADNSEHYFACPVKQLRSELAFIKKTAFTLYSDFDHGTTYCGLFAVGDKKYKEIERNFTHPLNEVNTDNESGIGATPNNRNIDYLGMRVYMKPSAFLQMAHELDMDHDTMKRIDDMATYIKTGAGVASPFLSIDIPSEWEDGDLTKPAKVVSHEGRHRMEAIMKAEGNQPIEVHLLFPGLRRRNITDEMIARLNMNIISQRKQLLKGPWFVVQ